MNNNIMNNNMDAVVFQMDGIYFAFVRKYPAAAVSANNLDDLFKRLRIALADVIQYEQFNYVIQRIPA